MYRDDQYRDTEGIQGTVCCGDKLQMGEESCGSGPDFPEGSQENCSLGVCVSGSPYGLYANAAADTTVTETGTEDNTGE